MTDMTNSSFFPFFKNEIIPTLVDSFVMSKIMQMPIVVVENKYIEIPVVVCEIMNFSQYQFAKSIVDNPESMKNIYQSFPDVKGSEANFTKAMRIAINEFESSPDFKIMEISFSSEN